MNYLQTLANQGRAIERIELNGGHVYVSELTNALRAKLDEFVQGKSQDKEATARLDTLALILFCVTDEKGGRIFDEKNAEHIQIASNLPDSVVVKILDAYARLNAPK